MSNSVYGKTIENKGERPDIHLIKTERRETILQENLILIIHGSLAMIFAHSK